MRRPDFYTAAAPMAVVLAHCRVLLGTLHQRASLWLAGSSGDPAQPGTPVSR